MKLHRKLIGVLIVALSLTSISPTLFAKEYASLISKWTDKGVVSTSDVEEITSKRIITRAEFARILVNLFGYSNTKTAKNYTDVTADKWYSPYISKISSAGIMHDYNTTFKPNAPLTREDAAYALAHAYKMSDEHLFTTKCFSDADEISNWAHDSIHVLYDNGYIKGTTDNTFNPKGSLTYAEALAMLDRMSSEVIHKAGIYTQDISGNLVVNTPNVTLKNMTIQGNLYLAEGIGDGDIDLENVTVEGQIFVEGGGINSIKMTNSTAKNGIDVSARNPVRIVNDNTETAVLLSSNTHVILTGTFHTVSVGSNATAMLTDVSITTLTVPASTGNPPTIELSKTSTIDKVETQKAATINGNGLIGELIAHVAHVRVAPTPAIVTFANKEISIQIAGKNFTIADAKSKDVNSININPETKEVVEEPVLPVTPSENPPVVTTPPTDPATPLIPNTPSTNPTTPSIPNTPSTNPTAPSIPNTPSTNPTTPSIPNTPSTNPSTPSDTYEPNTPPIIADTTDSNSTPSTSNPSDDPYTPSDEEVNSPSHSTDNNPTTPDDNNPTTPDDNNPTTPDDNNPTTPDNNNPTTPDDNNPTTPDDNNPTTPDDNNPTTPDNNNPTTPDDNNPTTPDDNNPTIPDDNNPTTPDDNNPTTPDDNNPTTPDDNNPTTPDDNNPTIPDDNNPTTPDDNNPTTPDDNNPTTPDDNNPTTPDDNNPTTPDDNNPTTPDDNNPIVPPDDNNPTTPDDNNPIIPPGTPTIADFEARREQLETKVLELVNIERQKANEADGLTIGDEGFRVPLQLDETCREAARAKSQDMFNNTYYSHNGGSFGTFESQSNVLSYFGIQFVRCAENIARNQESAEQVMYDWMHSEGHRKNILNPEFNKIGIGYAENLNGVMIDGTQTYYLWTQEFIKAKTISDNDTPSYSQGSTVKALDESYRAAFEEECLRLVNEERAKANKADGLTEGNALYRKPLVMDEACRNAARFKTEDMITKGYFAHETSQATYPTIWALLKAYNVQYGLLFGENIAFGQTSAQEVMSRWMGSEGHRKQILDYRYDRMGIGYSEAESNVIIEYNGSVGPTKIFWAQEFASPSESLNGAPTINRDEISVDQQVIDFVEGTATGFGFNTLLNRTFANGAQRFQKDDSLMKAAKLKANDAQLALNGKEPIYYNFYTDEQLAKACGKDFNHFLFIPIYDLGNGVDANKALYALQNQASAEQIAALKSGTYTKFGIGACTQGYYQYYYFFFTD